MLAGAVAHRLPTFALPHIPYGGYHLWPRLPDDVPEAALLATALRTGVAAAPGRPYFCAEPPAGHIRLSFAGVAGPAEIAEGVRRLRAAVDELTA